jgi:hypothetical protein
MTSTVQPCVTMAGQANVAQRVAQDVPGDTPGLAPGAHGRVLVLDNARRLPDDAEPDNRVTFGY